MRARGQELGNQKMTNKWVVTPSLRVATFSHFNKMGEDVLVETDLKAGADLLDVGEQGPVAGDRRGLRGQRRH